MKKERLKQIGITVLGWIILITLTANIARAINPSTNPEDTSGLEVFIGITVTLFGWVPFYFYFKRKKTVTPEESSI
jgi:hypothetical protein